MLSSTEINEDIKTTEKELIALRKLELESLETLFEIIESDNWNAVDFCLTLKKEDAQKINKFDFKSCIDIKIIEAMKKLIKVGVAESIKERKEIIKNFDKIK